MKQREIMMSRLVRDLVGPSSEDEVLSSYPGDVYLTGMLYPQKAEILPEESAQDVTESSRDINGTGTESDEVSLAASRKPASAGLSFGIGADHPVVDIEISCASYVSETDPGDPGDRGGLGTGSPSNGPSFRRRWRRETHIDHIANVHLVESAGDRGTAIENLGLHIRTSTADGLVLATVAMVNLNSLEGEYERTLIEESTFFQTSVRVRPAAGARLLARPLGYSAIDSDTKSAALIYRDVVDFAVGHTCSADWTERDDGTAEEVRSTWVPTAEVPGMSADGDQECFGPLIERAKLRPEEDVLLTLWSEQAQGDALISGLRELPDAWLAWLLGQEARIEGLPSEHRGTAADHIAKAKQVSARMHSALDRLASDPDLLVSFRMMSRAMRIQRCWTERKDDVVLRWRPFQLAFILLVMESMLDREHPARDVADLLWFPTGGGKTEAYLGLVALLLFYRRLRDGNAGAGVNVVMRYTLRLLTTQQFQRAATLILACDHLRLAGLGPDGEPRSFGNKAFSIGLWAGGDATPNTTEKSAESLSAVENASRPDVLARCPRHPGEGLWWRVEGGRTIATCRDSLCDWHNVESPLPVWTVDEDVYRELPSLLIGTIDKFAQLVRQAPSGALFGVGTDYCPPDLVIQDELHLISGPLGTLAGIYEMAIDGLCTHVGHAPKVIASTATIRQADDQIRALFNRRTCLFPPPVIDASNSGFATVDDDSPTRLYVGLTTAGRSAKYTLQAAAATLLQGADACAVTPAEKDAYWTLVTYFNSLRELGSALVLMQDDVGKTIQEVAAREGREPRPIGEPAELTSRVSSTGIREILDNLDIPCGTEGACDVLLSSNMISVGVDVPRLGLMVVNGQPKSIAEYIQATSRVGRDTKGPGGLVVTLYNNAKARDQSHFETFQTWHRALYRDVEATSVTPFAPQATTRALHAAFVILARHCIEGLKKIPNSFDEDGDAVDDIRDIVAKRVKAIDPAEEHQVMSALEDFIGFWDSSAGVLGEYWNDRRYNKSLLISAERAAEIEALRGVYGGVARPTPNSMRNVEPMTQFVLKEAEKEGRR